MEDLKARIGEVAELMDEYGLSEAELQDDGYRVAFRRRTAVAARPAAEGEVVHEAPLYDETPIAPPVDNKPAGIPVSSPMTGIYYSAPSPNAPPFVKEGEPVTAGQVVGLIEAMKVFNEITAPTSGTVTKLTATSGQLVQPGDPLLYIG